MKKLLVSLLAFLLALSLVACTNNSTISPNNSSVKKEILENENSVKINIENVKWEDFTFEKTVDVADTIIRAKIAERGEAIEIENKHYTQISLNVIDIFKGQNVASSLDILEYGGDFGENIYVVDNAPLYEVGQEYIFFLNKYDSVILPVEEYQNYAGIPNACQAILIENSSVNIEETVIDINEYINSIEKCIAKPFKYNASDIESVGYCDSKYPITDSAVIEQICNYLNELEPTEKTYENTDVSVVRPTPNYKFTIKNSSCIYYYVRTYKNQECKNEVVLCHDEENLLNTYSVYNDHNTVELINYIGYYLSENYKTFGGNKPDEVQDVLNITEKAEQAYISTSSPINPEIYQLNNNNMYLEMVDYINSLELDKAYALQTNLMGETPVSRKFIDMQSGEDFTIATTKQPFHISPDNDETEYIDMLYFINKENKGINYGYVINEAQKDKINAYLNKFE